MSIAESRARICAIARSWIGTPYHHMGRVKGAGADCAMFPLEVYRAAGLIDNIEVPFYPRDWMLHRSEEVYLGIVQQHAREIENDCMMPAAPLPSDFVMFHFGRCWSHGGIVLDYPLIVHAVLNQGVVLADIEHDGFLLGRKRRFFTPF